MSERDVVEADEMADGDDADELYDLDEDGTEAEPRKRFDVDDLIDKLIPGEIDWRHMVRQHPVVCLGAVGLLGFLLGRSRGAAIVAGASAAVTNAVMRQLSDVFEGEMFEF